MNKRLAVLMIAFTWCAAGQGTTAPASKPAEIETKLILLKHASASGIARLLNNAGLPVAGDNGLGAIVVRSTPDKIEQVERIVKQLDAEPRPQAQTELTNCDLIIYVLGGTKTSFGEGQLSQGLLPVVKQLKAVFRINPTGFSKPSHSDRGSVRVRTWPVFCAHLKDRIAISRLNIL